MNNESPSKSTRVAYFSMEIALESGIPTYSGGLGVLAGDMLRSAADLGVPMVGITLIHRRGYFRQRLDPRGNQFEDDAQWNPEELLEETSARASVEIEGRAGSPACVEILHSRTFRARGSRLSARFKPGRKHDLGPNSHGSSLRRRCSLPVVPGSIAGHRRRENSSRTWLHRAHQLSHE